MRIHTLYVFAIVVVFGSSAASPAFAQVQLPPNLHVPPIYNALIASIADHSPTFEGQLERIAAASEVTVHVAVVRHIIGARAKTRMVRQNDGLIAWIEVARLDNVIELIAHELEHVIEQMDGVDLRGGAGMARAGIYGVSVDGTTFETDRAARVGVNVAREVRASLDQ